MMSTVSDRRMCPTANTPRRPEDLLCRCANTNAVQLHSSNGNITPLPLRQGSQAGAEQVWASSPALQSSVGSKAAAVAFQVCMVHHAICSVSGLLREYARGHV